MNNLLSYRGLVDAKIRASDKDLPVRGFISITYFFFCITFQVKEPESFRQLSLPQIEIPFRDMASIVTEAEAAIVHRFEVLEPQIYNSNARQVPKSPEWFMSASSKIKVIAKNMTKVALVAEEVA